MDPEAQAPREAQTEEREDETQWTDDRIRWHEDLANNNDPPKDPKEEEECAYIDPFKDPDPFETFSFQFEVASTSEEVESARIDIELRGYKKGADQVWQSTGLTLWRASKHLCRFLAAHPEMIRGKPILELGAGLGLCGILAHRLGGSRVCITDGDTDALVHLRENLRQNKDENNNSEVSGRQLIWGKETSEVFQKRFGTFDVLLASDIIYARCIVEPLWETVRILLNRNENAMFIMAYFARRDVNVTIDFVLSYANEVGFSYELVEEDPGGVCVYVFQWKRAEI